MDIFKESKKRIIIAAHRGVSGGNIPCNTTAAYESALLQGADMIEIDANMSADGTLYIFHPEMEKSHLNKDVHIPELHDEEIEKLRYCNFDREETQFGLCTMEEVFKRFRGRCFINVDKFLNYPEKISELIRKYDMADQIIVKTYPMTEMWDIMDNYPEIAYLPIIKKPNGVHEMLMKRKLRYVGAEVVFTDENDGVGSKEYIEKLHADGKIVWANAIVYDYKVQLAAGHSDDVSVTGEPEKGWGWLADRGYDIIQTDWTLALKTYLEKTGRR